MAIRTRELAMEAGVWLKRVIAIFVVILFGYFVLGYLGDTSKIRVTVTNANDYAIDAYARLNISSHKFLSSEVYTIPAHSKFVMSTWYVQAGSREVSVAWGPAGIAGSPGPDSFFYFHTYYLMPFSTKNVVVDATCVYVDATLGA